MFIMIPVIVLTEDYSYLVINNYNVRIKIAVFVLTSFRHSGFAKKQVKEILTHYFAIEFLHFAIQSGGNEFKKVKCYLLI